MNNYFGISFSGRGLHLVHTREDTLSSAEVIPYPLPPKLKELFADGFMEEMAKIVRDKKDEYDADDLSLKIALPAQYAFLKKVAVPLDTDSTTLFEQMKWDLDSYLPDKIENYKVVKTDIEYDFESHKELLVICINKSIIQSFIDLSTKAEAHLDELVLDTFCIERFLKNNNYWSESSNTVVIKIDTFVLKTDLFINGKYYQSFSEPLQGLTHNVPLDERIQDIIKQHLGQIESHLEFLPFVKVKDLNLFIHGCGLSDQIYNTLQSAVNQELIRLPSPQRQIDNLNMDNISPETLGVVNYHMNI